MSNKILWKIHDNESVYRIVGDSEANPKHPSLIIEKQESDSLGEFYWSLFGGLTESGMVATYTYSAIRLLINAFFELTSPQDIPKDATPSEEYEPPTGGSTE
jgi:hypothetical protein